MRSLVGFAALSVVGNLFPPEFLQTIAEQKAKHQAAADYGLTKSLVLKDEIARYWRMANDVYASGGAQWLPALLRDVFGYADLAPTKPEFSGDHAFSITHLAFGGAVRFVLVPHDLSLDRAAPLFGESGCGRAPQVALQEALNADPTRPWGIVSNGALLRLVRENPSLTRPAYLQADFDRIFQEELYADFAALWLAIHASRLAPVGGKAANCILEAWRVQAQETGERALEHLRDGVTAALRALGNGFLNHHENDRLRARIADGSLSADDFFQELLRLVYRLLFLFTAEDRGLLHDPAATDEQRAIYHEGYSVSRLRERALLRRHYDRHADLWQGLRVLFDLLNVGALPLGLPVLGGLFAPEQCPRLDAALIPNASLLDAIRALAYFRSGASLVRVNYRDMGTEELGSVYESLLELHPYLNVDNVPWTLAFIGIDGAKTKGSSRKLTGSYYTPASLVNELIKSALDPVIAQTVGAHRNQPRGVLLGLRILDPACGSGHFLLAAARRLAVEIARLEAPANAPDEAVRQHALREVVQHCIYGVDRNPLAVELCKAALWIETVEPGKPLTFLDPHVRCGDSLIGILDPTITSEGIPDEAYAPITSDDKAACRDLKKRNRQSAEAVQGGLFDQQSLHSVGAAERAFAEMPEDTPAEIGAKRAAWSAAQIDARRRHEGLRADIYVAAFFAPKTKETLDLVPTNEDLTRLKRGMFMRSGVEAFVQDLARRHRFFHWYVAFAEIMQRGGFDVVVGNPPWERVKLEEKEFFEQRSPTIATAPNKAARKKLISALIHASALPGDKALYCSFQESKRESDASSHFMRSSGRFPLTGVGDVNTYAVFAETFLYLASSGGRAGLIVPTGIATDSPTRAFFWRIFSSSQLRALYDFRNDERLFSSVAGLQRFCLLTLSGSANEEAPSFVFLAKSVSALAEHDRRFSMTTAELLSLNPNSRTCPVFRSHADAELTKKIYAQVPVLLDESKGKDGNPWGIEFRTMFHMANDSELFSTADQLAEVGGQRHGNTWIDAAAEAWLPLYEAKMITNYDHRFGAYPLGFIDDTRALPRPTLSQYQNANYEPLPRYWVRKQDVERRLREAHWERGWLAGWRDITNTNNEHTVLSCALPKAGVNHKFPLFFASNVDCTLGVLLLGNLSSLILDYIARQKLGGTSLTYFYLKQLAVAPPCAYGANDVNFILPRVLELSYTSAAMRPFALDLGYDGKAFVWDPERRAFLRAELDAYYARLYSLTRNELRYVLDPADIYGPDYPSETFRVLKEREIREYGEYRTARLVMQAWDKLEETKRAEPAAIL